MRFTLLYAVTQINYLILADNSIDLLKSRLVFFDGLVSLYGDTDSSKNDFMSKIRDFSDNNFNLLIFESFSSVVNTQNGIFVSSGTDKHDNTYGSLAQWDRLTTNQQKNTRKYVSLNSGFIGFTCGDYKDNIKTTDFGILAVDCENYAKEVSLDFVNIRLNFAELQQDEVGYLKTVLDSFIGNLTIPAFVTFEERCIDADVYSDLYDAVISWIFENKNNEKLKGVIIRYNEDISKQNSPFDNIYGSWSDSNDRTYTQSIQNLTGVLSPEFISKIIPVKVATDHEPETINNINMIPGYIDWNDLLDTTLKVSQMKSTNLTAIGVWSYHTDSSNDITDNYKDIIDIGKMFESLEATQFSCKVEHCAECLYSIWNCETCVNYYSLENDDTCVYDPNWIDPTTTQSTATQTATVNWTETVTTTSSVPKIIFNTILLLLYFLE